MNQIASGIILLFVYSLCVSAQQPTPGQVSEKLQIKFPLVYIDKKTSQAATEEVTLTISPIPTTPSEGPKITFTTQNRMETVRNAILPHLQVAALLSAFVIDSPWSSIDFSIDTRDQADYSGSTAALGVAMIASAHRRDWAAQTAVVAELRPDTTLAPVRGMKMMLEKLAEAGIKKIVVAPAIHPDSGFRSFNDLSKWCESKGIKCMPALHLRDATRLAYDLAPTNLSVEAFPETLSTNLQTSIQRESKLLTDKNSSLNPFPSLRGTRKAKGNLNPSTLMESAQTLKKRGEAALEKGELLRADELLRQAHINVQVARAISSSTPENNADRLLGNAKSTRNQINNLLFEIPDRDPQINNVLRWTLLERYLNTLHSSVETKENIASKMINSAPDSPLTKEAGDDLDIIVTTVKTTIAEEPTPTILMTGIAQMDTTLPYALNGRQIFALVSPALEGFTELLARDLLLVPVPYRENLINDSLFVFTLHRWSEKAAKTYYSKYYSDRRTRLSEENLSGPQFTLGGGYMPPLPKPKPLPIDNISFEFQIFYDLGNISRLGLLRELYGVEKASWSPEKSQYIIPHPKLLEQALENAEQMARHNLNKATEKPVNLTPLAYLYESSRVLMKEPEQEFKLRALMGFWRVSIMSMTLSMMDFEDLSQETTPATPPTDQPPQDKEKITDKETEAPTEPPVPSPSPLPVPSEL